MRKSLLLLGAALTFPSVTSAQNTLTETFNAGSKTGYAAGDVTTVLGSWNLTEALLGSAAADKRSGGASQAVRTRTNGTASMNFNTSNVRSVTVLSAIYGTDTAPASWLLNKSVNDGGAWTQVGSTVTLASNTTLATSTFTVDQAGKVRFQLRSNTAGTTPRINFDDFTINRFDVTLAAGTTTASVSEGDVVSITATLSTSDGGVTLGDVPVTITLTSGDEADFEAPPAAFGGVSTSKAMALTASYTFPTGTASGTTHTFNFTTVADNVTEPSENFTFTLTTSSPAADGTSITTSTADVNIGASLPVELTSFTGAASGSLARLSWTTASETNNLGFFVEQKVGESWDTVSGLLAGRGTTTEKTDYAYTVDGLTAGTHTFRLRQVDTDGTVHYSPTTSVEIGVDGEGRVTLLGQRAVRVETNASQQVSVSVYDVLGRSVSSQEVTVDGTAVVSLPALSSGAYLVRVVGEGFATTKTLVVR